MSGVPTEAEYARCSNSELMDLLESERDSAYIITPSTELLWINSAFSLFWSRNGGIGDGRRLVGQEVAAAVPRELSSFYEYLYGTAHKTKRNAWHRYECSSPTQLRWFTQLVVPRRDVLVVVNRLLFGQSRARPTLATGPACIHCGCPPNAPGTWARTPESDGFLCPVCRDYYFGEDECAPHGGAVDWASPAEQLEPESLIEDTNSAGRQT